MRWVKERLDPEGLLMEGARQVGAPLSLSQLPPFLQYLRELQGWNTRINLTAITEEREIVIRHFVDSLACLQAFPLKEWIKLIDVGTGAGFPGIPLKLYKPGIHLTLVEPSQKRGAFLHHLCGLLGLKQVEIIAERLETIIRMEKFFSAFDLILVRALATPTERVKGLLSLLRPGGRMILFKGKTRQDWGGELPKDCTTDTIQFVLPFSNDPRSLVVIEKSGKAV